MAELCDSLAFLNANYDEALDLAEQTRDWLVGQDRSRGPDLPPLERMAISCATLKVTSRLTQVIAWLLVQRAVQAGEMTREQAAQAEHRLSGHEVCLTPGPLEHLDLPKVLEDIFQRSHLLGLLIEAGALDSQTGLVGHCQG